jgi:YebC/PmpR family DNA-binding regulatory protein
MSGHSKWSQIKRKKGVADAKRGAIFTKVANIITIAARNGGGDPDMNPRLFDAIAKAKEVNMPKENIERAIKRGTGELEGMTIEEMTIEAYGPHGSAFIIEAITDNKNRTISDIRNILSRYDGKVAQTGSVAYQFAKKGVLTVTPASEETELTAIDAGASDTKIENDILTIYTEPRELKKTQAALGKTKIETAEIEYIPSVKITPTADDKTKIENLIEALLENDDVNNVFSNL